MTTHPTAGGFLVPTTRNDIPEPTAHAGVRLVSLVTERVLRYVASEPGACTIDVKHGARLSHHTQAWKVLTRLERQGLVASRRHANAKAWTLTAPGHTVLQGLPEGIYA